MESTDRTVSPSGRPSALTVLHVEDDPAFAELTRIHLERARDSLTVVSETDPEAALEWLETAGAAGSPPVDCIVSDYQMPRLDGIELLRAVRARYPSLPFVLYTGQGSEEVAADAFAADATDYLRKDSGSAAAEVLANRIESAVTVEGRRSDYRELFEAAGDGILVHETSGDRILDANPAFCDLVGHDREELLGMGVGDFSADTPEYDAEAAAARIERAATGAPESFEWVVRHADGHLVPVEVTLTRAALGGNDRVVAHVRDVSRRREQERQFEAIFNGTFQFIGLLDPDGTLLEANDTALAFGGFEEADVVGRPFWEAPWWAGDEERVGDLRRAVGRAAAGEFVRYDVQVDGVDGPAVIDFSLKPVRGEGGEVELLIPEGRNVSDLRRTEAALRESEERYERVVENVQDVVFETDTEGRWTYLNDAWEATTGRGAASTLGEPCLECVHPSGRSRGEFAPLVAGETDVCRQELELLTDDGGTLLVEAFARAVRGPDGEFQGTVGVLRDVTDQRDREQTLARQNQRLRAAYERLDEGYYAVDGDWTVTYWNDRMAERTGLRPEEAVGQSLWEAAPSFVGTEFEIYYREAMAAQRSVSFEGFDEAFDQWVEVRVYPSSDGLSVYSRDVSERKAREDELARMRDLLDMAQELTGVGGWEYDVRSGEGLLTTQTRVMFGVDDLPEGWAPSMDAVARRYHEDDREEFRSAVRAALDDGVPFDLELRLAETTPDGDPRWVRQICQPVSMGGETVLLRGTVQDVTERHAFERRLRSREREIREERAFTDSLLDALPDPFYLFDAGGWLARWNETFGERTGYADATLAGMHVLDFVPSSDADRVEAWLDAVADGRTATVESALVTADGEHFPHEFNASPVYDGQGRDYGLAGAARDISARVAREGELERQNERLESFTSIVSHDLRNPLAVMRGALEGGEDDPVALDRARRALGRMETLVDDLLTLSRQGEDVGETMGVDLESIARRSWRLADTGEAELAVDGTVALLADPSRLTQAFENLFRNAVEHGSTGNRSAERSDDAVEHGSDDADAAVHVGPLPDSDGFYVADDGPGIPPERRDLVFEHGFTDSPDGTGFGLAIVRSIVEAHGWTVSVTESETGGARFEVRGVDRVGV
jgi:PAS domain S-box-containing protein